MIVFVSFIIIVAIIIIVFYLGKIVKEEKGYIDEDKKVQAAEIEKKRNNLQDLQSKSTVFSEEDFEKLLLEAKNDPNKLDNLKSAIQENLRKSIKAQDMNSSRKCNMQLKRIDIVEKEGKFNQ